MKKEYTKKIYDFSSGSWVIILQWYSSNSSSMMFFLFFLAWDQFFSPLRDVWDKRMQSSLNSHEKPLSNRKFALPAPIIAVHNFCTFLTTQTSERISLLRSAILIIMVHNSCPEVFFTWFFRVGSIHLAPSLIFHVDIFVYTP
jgi:hypothetical protein